MHGSNCVLTSACAAWNASESCRTALWLGIKNAQRCCEMVVSCDPGGYMLHMLSILKVACMEGLRLSSVRAADKDNARGRRPLRDICCCHRRG